MHIVFTKRQQTLLLTQQACVVLSHTLGAVEKFREDTELHKHWVKDARSLISDISKNLRELS
jgi:hypothetical protein